MAALPGVLGCSFDYAQDRLTLRRTTQVRLETNTLWLPGARPSNSRSLRSAQTRTASGIYDKRVPSFAVSRQQFMKYPG
jgi:hypothetical protein